MKLNEALLKSNKIKHPIDVPKYSLGSYFNHIAVEWDAEKNQFINISPLCNAEPFNLTKQLISSDDWQPVLDEPAPEPERRWHKWPEEKPEGAGFYIIQDGHRIYQMLEAHFFSGGWIINGFELTAKEFYWCEIPKFDGE